MWGNMRERLRNWGLYIGLGIGLLLGLIMVIIGFDLVPKFPDKDTLRAWSMRVFPPPTGTVVCKVGVKTISLADVKLLVKYYRLADEGANGADQTLLSIYHSNSNTIGQENNTLSGLVSRLADEQIILRKAEERGLTPLPEADQAALKTLAHLFYTKYKLCCKDLGLTEEQLLARFTVLQVETLLMGDVTKTITAPEPEVKAAYETLAEYEKELFRKSPSIYIEMCNGVWKYELNHDDPWCIPYSTVHPELVEGLPALLKPGTSPVVVYRPADYRLIRHLLIPMQKAVDLEAQARTEKNKTIMDHMRKNKLDDNDRKEMDRIEQEVAREFLAKIKPQADETMEKLRNGADINDFIAERNDTAWIYSDLLNTDYQIGLGTDAYLLQIVNRADRLDKVGDIAGPIGSQYGYHIIQWVGNVPAGPIPYEEVRDQVEAALLFDERAAAWAAALAQWRQEANVEVQTGKLPEDLPSIIY